MTTLTTDSIYAERQRNGDVWISSRTRKWTAGGKFPPTEPEPIIIPQSKCKELAELLWPNVESDEEEWVPNYQRPPYKVDYTHYAGEPE